MEADSNLRRRRRELGRTLFDARDLSGISISTISCYERGIQPPEKVLPALARAYSMSVDELRALIGMAAGDGSESPAA